MLESAGSKDKLHGWAKTQEGAITEMLRGVNKKIIEVVDTQNDYFERAILFLKDRKLEEDEGAIKKNADEFMKSTGSAKLRRMLYSNWLREGAKLACAAGAGAFLMFLIGVL